MRKVLFFVMLVFSLSISAQYSFTISGNYYGCGKETAEMQKLYNQYAGSFQTSGIPTRALCEQIRAQVNAINVNYGGCGFRLSASPCSGREMSNTINVGATKVNVQGAGQESSFFSNNVFNEIQNWSNDVARRRMGLDQNNENKIPDIVDTGDSNYDSARSNYEFSGNMPRGTVSLINAEGLSISKIMPQSSRSSVTIPDDLLSGERPFNSLGGGYSPDFDVIRKPLTPTNFTLREKEDFDYYGYWRDVAKLGTDIAGVFDKTPVTALLKANINVWSEVGLYCYKMSKGESYESKLDLTGNPIIDNIAFNYLHDIDDVSMYSVKTITGLTTGSIEVGGMKMIGIAKNAFDLGGRTYDAYRTYQRNHNYE